MAFCKHCGANMAENAQFCPACGKPQAQSPAPAGGAPAATTGLTSNVVGALCYVLGIFTGVLFLVLEPYKNDKFVRFHAFQSILMTIVLVVVEIVLGFLTSMLAFIFWIFWPLFSLAVFLLWVFLMYKAYSNEKFKLPIIGDQAERMAG